MKKAKISSDKDFTLELEVDKGSEAAFLAINNVRGWWSEGLEGRSEKLDDEFIYRHTDIHYSKQKLVEVVPGKRVVWLVTDSHLNFINHREEWNGTQVRFEIMKSGRKTLIRFTHMGLVPSLECFDACSGGWTYYLDSLYQLIETGKGTPDPRSNSPKTSAGG